MSEINRHPMGYDQNSQPIAEGAEKKVYEHLDNSEKVVKVTVIDRESKNFEPGNERLLKAEFYLTKLLHLLAPDKIPDIHLISQKYKTSVHERKELGAEHLAVNYEIMNDHSDEISEIEAAAREELSMLVDLSDIVKNLKEIGLEEIDDTAHNFNVDPNGVVSYLDSVEPWTISSDGQVLFRNFSITKLRNTIHNRLQGNDLIWAEKCLNRLITLVSEEKRNLKKK